MADAVTLPVPSVPLVRPDGAPVLIEKPWYQLLKALADAHNNLSAASTDLTSEVTGTLPVANGGTGLDALSTYQIVAGGTTGTSDVQQIGNGTSGDPLVSAGADALPAFGKITLTDSISGLIQYPDNNTTYTIWQNLPYAITTLSLTSICTTGTCNTILRYNDSSNLISNATSTSQTVGTSTDNWSAGDDLGIRITGLTGAEYVSFTIKFTRSIP